MNKKKGVLSPAQSQYLGRTFRCAAFVVQPYLKQMVMQAYLDSTDEQERPSDIDKNILGVVDYANATADKFVEYGQEVENGRLTLEDIVQMVNLGDFVESEPEEEIEL